jgi:N-acetylglutamate synthase-like GNAT family acetyltransferase
MTDEKHEHRWRMHGTVDDQGEPVQVAAWDGCHSFGFGYACDCGALMTTSEDRIVSRLWDETPPGGCARCEELRRGARIRRVTTVTAVDGTRQLHDIAFEQSVVHAAGVAGGAVRRARAGEDGRIEAIEHAELEGFLADGWDVPGPPPEPQREGIARAVADGLSWVVTDGDGEVIASLRATIVGTTAHIDRVAVVPAWSRRRLGRGLIDMLGCQVEDEGVRTLTTFALSFVPWHVFYLRDIGFRRLEAGEMTPELREVLRRARPRSRPMTRSTAGRSVA